MRPCVAVLLALVFSSVSGTPQPVTFNLDGSQSYVLSNAHVSEVTLSVVDDSVESVIDIGPNVTVDGNVRFVRAVGNDAMKNLKATIRGPNTTIGGIAYGTEVYTHSLTLSFMTMRGGWSWPGNKNGQAVTLRITGCDIGREATAELRAVGHGYGRNTGVDVAVRDSHFGQRLGFIDSFSLGGANNSLIFFRNDFMGGLTLLGPQKAHILVERCFFNDASLQIGTGGSRPAAEVELKVRYNDRMYFHISTPTSGYGSVPAEQNTVFEVYGNVIVQWQSQSKIENFKSVLFTRNIFKSHVYFKRGPVNTPETTFAHNTFEVPSAASQLLEFHGADGAIDQATMYFAENNITFVSKASPTNVHLIRNQNGFGRAGVGIVFDRNTFYFGSNAIYRSVFAQPDSQTSQDVRIGLLDNHFIQRGPGPDPFSSIGLTTQTAVNDSQLLRFTSRCNKFQRDDEAAPSFGDVTIPRWMAGVAYAPVSIGCDECEASVDCSALWSEASATRVLGRCACNCKYAAAGSSSNLPRGLQCVPEVAAMLQPVAFGALAPISVTRSLSRTTSPSVSATLTVPPTRTRTDSSTLTRTASHSASGTPSLSTSPSQTLSQSRSVPPTSTLSMSRSRSASGSGSVTRSVSRLTPSSTISHRLSWSRDPSHTLLPSPRPPPRNRGTLAGAMEGTIAEAAVIIIGRSGQASSVAVGLANPTAATKSGNMDRLLSAIGCKFVPGVDTSLAAPDPTLFVAVFPITRNRDSSAVCACLSTLALLAALLGMIVVLPATEQAVTDGRTTTIAWKMRRGFGAVIGALVPYYAPSVVNIGTTLATHGSEAWMQVTGVASVLAAVALIGVCCWVVVRLPDDVAAAFSDPAALPPRKFRKLAESQLCHGAPIAKRFFAAGQVLSATFDVTRDPGLLALRLVVYEDIAVSLLLGVIGGAKIDAVPCVFIASLQLLVVGAHVVYVMGWRPFASIGDRFFATLLGVMQFAFGASCLVVTLSDPDTTRSDDALLVIGWVGVIMNAIFFIMLALMLYAEIKAACTKAPAAHGTDAESGTDDDPVNTPLLPAPGAPDEVSSSAEQPCEVANTTPSPEQYSPPPRRPEPPAAVPLNPLQGRSIFPIAMNPADTSPFRASLRKQSGNDAEMTVALGYVGGAGDHRGISSSLDDDDDSLDSSTSSCESGDVGPVRRGGLRAAPAGYRRVGSRIVRDEPSARSSGRRRSKRSPLEVDEASDRDGEGGPVGVEATSSQRTAMLKRTRREAKSKLPGSRPKSPLRTTHTGQPLPQAWQDL